MKSSINHVLAFILMILLIFISTFISIKIAFSSKNVIRVLENSEYYEKSYSNIHKEIDNYVINDELNDLYKKHITKDLIEKDINSIISNFYSKKESNINRYDEFYQIFIKYNKDKDMGKTYASEINDIYTKNIFPTSEFNLLNKFYFGSLDLLFVLIISTVAVLFISTILAFTSKKYKYHLYSLSGYSIFIIIVNILIKILFRNFMYTNEYFTKFLLSIVSNIFTYQLAIAIIIILGILILKKLKKVKE